MMKKSEEAIIYATIMHQGKVRKLEERPFIFHPLEVAQILSTMTDDEEIITAGILHDIVEDTDGTLAEIEKRFGKRVADLVATDSEKEYHGEKKLSTWKKRKEETLKVLKNSTDIGVKMLWLADKLANIRSLAGMYSELGDEIWQKFNQSDPEMQRWYYKSIAQLIELSLNKTGAFKELIKHINFIWPETFDTDKTKFRKYKEVSVEGCELLGRGAKGEVYRYDDELVIKVFNENNTYHDVEQEIAQTRKAFILGIPTAISFGIVSVGEKYGAMFEMVDADTLSRCIARSPKNVDQYAAIMADVATVIHGIEASESDGFPYVYERIKDYIVGGIGMENTALSKKCMKLIDKLPASNTLVHGDFHTGNVFLQNGEALLIDMDRVSMGHPIIELSDLYYFYVVLGEEDPAVVEKFMGFSYAVAKRFFKSFLKSYLKTEDEERLKEVTEKASLIGYSRLIKKFRKKGKVADKDKAKINFCVEKISELVNRLDTLAF
ncbi:MAG: HD domain-containing protein [Lachnospiraceae bacterium]|nr:HD domain-containing protein [Lachnospiraceae bacterium]